MTWQLMWQNMRTAALNATLQLLVIYRFEDQLLAFFPGSFFDWARAWGLTTSDSIPLFLSSLLLCIY